MSARKLILLAAVFFFTLWFACPSARPQIVIRPRAEEEIILATPDVQPKTPDKAAQVAEPLKTFNQVLWDDLKFSGYFTMAGKSFYPPPPIVRRAPSSPPHANVGPLRRAGRGLISTPAVERSRTQIPAASERLSNVQLVSRNTPVAATVHSDWTGPGRNWTEPWPPAEGRDGVEHPAVAPTRQTARAANTRPSVWISDPRTPSWPNPLTPSRGSPQAHLLLLFAGEVRLRGTAQQ